MINGLKTPAVIVDLDIVNKNISGLADKLKGTGIVHRPHIKTHKSPCLAKMQIDAGAIGITCAKLGEAEVMAESGFNDILIAYELIGKDKLERLYNLAKKVKVTTCVDSIECASGISSVGEKLGKAIPVYIEIDGGIHRCGLLPGKDVLDFANQIKNLHGIEIIGVLSYVGQIYDEKTIENIHRVARQEAKTLIETANILKKAGFNIKVISGGSSFSSKIPEELKGLTEVRAGSYIFNDVSQLDTNFITPNDCALRIVSTVISASYPGRAIIDAGSKTLSDATAHLSNGYGYVIENPKIKIVKLNEEHGYLEFSPEIEIKVGQQLTIIPNHVCTVVNLCDQLIGVKDGKINKMIPVCARGKSI